MNGVVAAEEKEDKQAARQAAPQRGKLFNEIQSIDGVRTALQLMDGMEERVAPPIKNKEQVGYEPEAPLPQKTINQTHSPFV